MITKIYSCKLETKINYRNKKQINRIRDSNKLYSLKLSNQKSNYSNLTTPILLPDETLDRMCQAVSNEAALHYKAFYSSEFGGIITEPAFMLVHVDDQMVHRGHSVSSTCYIENGCLYQLERQLDMLLFSTTLAHIPIAYSRDRIRKIILDTCVAASIKDGIVQFWLSSGRAKPKLTIGECKRPTFYVQVSEKKIKIPDFTEKSQVVSCNLTPTSRISCHLKHSNYIPGSICLKEAKEHHAQHCVFTDIDGYVLESSGGDFLIYTGDNRLLAPSLDIRLAGCVVKRIIELVKQFLDNDTPNIRADYEWLYTNINSAEFVPLLRPHEMLDLAKEVFLIGGDDVIIPVHKWNDEWVGSQFVHGKSELFRVIYTLLRQDMVFPGYDSSLLTPLDHSLYKESRTYRPITP